jgi:putative membrane protein
MSGRIQAAVAVAIWATATVTIAQSQPPWGWMAPWHMWGGWIFPLLMMATMAFVIVLCGLAIFRGVWGQGRSYRDAAQSSLQVLNERYARGEISKEEFEEKRSVLVQRA